MTPEATNSNCRFPFPALWTLKETETGNTPFAPAEGRATLGSDPSADLEPANSRRAGRSSSEGCPALILLLEQQKSDKSQGVWGTESTRESNSTSHRRPSNPISISVCESVAI